MSSSFLFILVLIFSIGALLAAWAGIRSIQSARTVVFYRTRQSRMMIGWQWLVASLALGLFAVGSLFFGNRVMDQIFSTAADPGTMPALTLTPFSFPSQTNTSLTVPTNTEAAPVTVTGSLTSQSTSVVVATPSRTPPYLGTYTALAVWTERRSTFIAMLSFTPTASRTPIPTWTRTPSSTPRPTYTASPTRTPRPTWTASPTRTPVTPRPTWTPSSTPTPITPSPTWTPSPTRTPRPTLTPTRTSTPTRLAVATP